jgi:hypothetical protein
MSRTSLPVLDTSTSTPTKPPLPRSSSAEMDVLTSPTSIKRKRTNGESFNSDALSDSGPPVNLTARCTRQTIRTGSSPPRAPSSAGATPPQAFILPRHPRAGRKGITHRGKLSLSRTPAHPSRTWPIGLTVPAILRQIPLLHCQPNRRTAAVPFVAFHVFETASLAATTDLAQTIGNAAFVPNPAHCDSRPGRVCPDPTRRRPHVESPRAGRLDVFQAQGGRHRRRCYQRYRQVAGTRRRNGWREGSGHGWQGVP